MDTSTNPQKYIMVSFTTLVAHLFCVCLLKLGGKMKVQNPFVLVLPPINKGYY